MVYALRMEDDVKKEQGLYKIEGAEAARIAQIPLNNPNPIMHVSVDGTLIFANPAAYEAPTSRSKPYARQHDNTFSRA